MESEKVYVKTVYSPQQMREPNISEYASKKEAEICVKICLKWGIGIDSCKIIPNLTEEEKEVLCMKRFKIVCPVCGYVEE